MDFTTVINNKSIYKITGTPENFLTAIKYMVWGFNDGNRNNWSKLNAGDILLFHSKGSDSEFFKNSKSCVIGFGVLNGNKYESKNLLWIDEFKANKCIYPYKFEFSEIYTFSEIPDPSTWDSQTTNSQERTKEVLNTLLSNGIPISSIEGFPIMGSYSTILQPSVKEAIIFSNNKLFDFSNQNDPCSLPTQFIQVTSPDSFFRNSTTLKVCNEITRRTINTEKKVYTRDLIALERAETKHYNTLSYVMEFFLSKGYDTYQNNHVDLFAHNNDSAFLIEVKSINKNNFKNQLRSGIVQLYEYNYFEIKKYLSDNNINPNFYSELLITSDPAEDTNYIDFINSLDKGIGFVDNRLIKPSGSNKFFKNIT